MPTADELLSGHSTDSALPANHWTVSEDLRTITIPAGQELLGVYHDEDTRRVWFYCPSECDGTDMSGFTVYVNYVNAAGEGDVYTVLDSSVSNGVMEFSWLVGRAAYASDGEVKVALRLVKYAQDGTTVAKEFNTMPATAVVGDGIQPAASSVAPYSDAFAGLVSQWSAQVAQETASALADCQAATSAAMSAAAGQALFTVEDGKICVLVYEGDL